MLWHTLALRRAWLLHKRHPSCFMDLSYHTASNIRLWSPTDLAQFSESPWAAWLERLVHDDPAHPFALAVDPPDAFMEMLSRRGANAERKVLQAAIDGSERRVINLAAVSGSVEARVTATARALASNPDIIYQAPLCGGGFFGIADFLVRLPPSNAADAIRDHATYMVWDVKLSHHARPAQLLQLCCYSEMLASMQHSTPEWAGLVLGGSQPLTFRLSAYSALYRT